MNTEFRMPALGWKLENLQGQLLRDPDARIHVLKLPSVLRVYAVSTEMRRAASRM